MCLSSIPYHEWRGEEDKQHYYAVCVRGCIILLIFACLTKHFTIVFSLKASMLHSSILKSHPTVLIFLLTHLLYILITFPFYCTQVQGNCTFYSLSPPLVPTSFLLPTCHSLASAMKCCMFYCCFSSLQHISV